MAALDANRETIVTRIFMAIFTLRTRPWRPDSNFQTRGRHPKGGGVTPPIGSRGWAADRIDDQCRPERAGDFAEVGAALQVIRKRRAGRRLARLFALRAAIVGLFKR
jgi:hypothetical protein